MAIKTTAHLNFRGDARAALTFYQTVFGGFPIFASYKDAGISREAADADNISWGQVTSDAGFSIMAYDVPEWLSYAPGENPVFVSVRGDDADEIKGYWEKLSDGAEVVQDLAPSGWSPLYGMLKDKFGVTWVLDVAVAYQAQ